MLDDEGNTISCMFKSSKFFKCGRLFLGPAIGKAYESHMQIPRENLWKINLSSWWFQPIWKICSSKWIISPGIGVNMKNVWNHHLDNVSFAQLYWLQVNLRNRRNLRRSISAAPTRALGRFFLHKTLMALPWQSKGYLLNGSSAKTIALVRVYNQQFHGRLLF